MPVTLESLRRDLSDGAAATQRADHSAQEIRKAAAERREVVQARLAELRARATSDAAAGDVYQALVAERGQLDLVLADAGDQ